MNADKIQEYRDNPALNQGLLKALLKGVRSYNKQMELKEETFYEEKFHLLVGQGVDTLITEGEDSFNDKYYPAMVSKPSDAIMAVIQETFSKTVEYYGSLRILKDDAPDLKDHLKRIWEACETFGYYVSRRKDDWQKDTRPASIVEAGKWYWKELLEGAGKIILTPEENEIIQSVYKSITTHHVTKEVFDCTPHQRIVFQEPIYFEYRGHQCKILPDWHKVDDEAMTIQPFDLKTTRNSPQNFLFEIKQWRYDIQAAYYTLGLISKYGLLGYKILPFKFLVETTERGAQGQPCIFECTEELLKVGRHGRPKMYLHFKADAVEDKPSEYSIPVVREVHGFEHALDLYEWHLDNGFETDRIILENENQFLINYDGAIFLK